jgi:hypothetical protein
VEQKAAAYPAAAAAAAAAAPGGWRSSRRWLHQATTAVTIVVVGHGRATDGVRVCCVAAACRALAAAHQPAERAAHVRPVQRQPTERERSGGWRLHVATDGRRGGRKAACQQQRRSPAQQHQHQQHSSRSPTGHCSCRRQCCRVAGLERAVAASGGCAQPARSGHLA